MMITRDDIDAAVKEWQKRLNLEHWIIKVDWDSVPAAPDAGANIIFTEKRDRATIKFEHNILAESAEVINNYIAHELMHAHFHEMYDTVYNMMDRDNGEIRMLLNYLHGEIEKVNDRVSTAFSSWASNPLITPKEN